MNGLHWYAWSPFDYETETDGISDDADLATRRLIDACFKRGGCVPDDDLRIARIIRFEIERWKNVRSEVLQFFRKAKGLVHHQHIDAEIRKAKRLQEARSLGGKLANAKRYAKRPLSGQLAAAEQLVNTDRQEDTDRDKKDSDADASLVSSPLRFEETSAHGAQKVFLTRVKKLKVQKGAVFKQLSQVGREKVDDALAAVERSKPAEPTSFFVACCQERIANGHDEAPPDRHYYAGPSEPLTDEMRDRIIAKMREE